MKSKNEDLNILSTKVDDINRRLKKISHIKKMIDECVEKKESLAPICDYIKQNKDKSICDDLPANSRFSETMMTSLAKSSIAPDDYYEVIAAFVITFSLSGEFCVLQREWKEASDMMNPLQQSSDFKEWLNHTFSQVNDLAVGVGVIANPNDERVKFKEN